MEACYNNLGWVSAKGAVGMRSKWRILTNRAGASMMFVLASMALLLILGTAAVRVASANAGAWHSKRDLNQLTLYADSMQRAIEGDLVSGGELAERIISDAFARVPYHADAGSDLTKNMDRESYLSNGTPDFGWTVTPSIAGGADIPADADISIAIGVWFESNSTRYRPRQTEDIPILDDNGDQIEIGGVPQYNTVETVSERLQRAQIREGRIKVTVTAGYRGRLVATRTEYRFSDFRRVGNSAVIGAMTHDPGGGENWWGGAISHERLEQN
jgi:hypothetical protein